MKPYQKNIGISKFAPDRHDGIPGTAKAITKSAKLEAKNANRSLKKGARQEAKKQIAETFALYDNLLKK